MREPKEMFECPHCDDLHDSYQGAKSCCKPVPSKVWLCPECGDRCETEQKARSCCAFDEVVCPGCQRSHGGKPMEQAAIAVSGHCTECNPLYTVEQQHAIEQLHYQATGEPLRLNA